MIDCCETMTLILIADDRRRGIVEVQSIKPNGDKRFRIVYRMLRGQRPILLNFCPFCGARLNQNEVEEVRE